VLEDLQLTSSPADTGVTAGGPAPSTRRRDVSRARTEVHLLDYARVIVKRRHVALAAFLVVTLGAMVYAFTATPIYEGRVQLLIESDDPNVVDFKQVTGDKVNASTLSRQDYYQTQYRLLQSRSVAAKTIETLSLWNNEELNPVEEEGFSPRRAVSGSIAWVQTLFASDDASAEDVEAAGSEETTEQARAIDSFLERLKITPVRNSRLADVSYRSKDAVLAAKVANAVAKSYIDMMLDFRFRATKEASVWLEEQLAEQRKHVEGAEARLQQYREQNDALSLEDRQNIVVQKLSDLNAAVTKAKTERLQKEAMYRQLVEVQNDPTQLDTFPAILSNDFIQRQKGELAALQRKQVQLGEKFGARHPEMIEAQSAIQNAQLKLQGEIAKVIQGVRTEYQAAVAQEQSMTAALDAQKGEALSMNRKAIDYGVIQRDVDSNTQIYQTLLQRAKETGVSGELRTSNVRVVDRAEVPVSPVSPRRLLAILAGLFGGGVFGIGLAFLFEYLDNRVKTPEEIERELGIPSLGLIPMLASATGQGNPLISGDTPANFAEAFRGLRTNILFSAADGGPRSIVVTSTGPSEGKTMVAGNVAIGLAQAGQRVLMIDADMRRPRTHELFDVPVEPGLSNLLVGAAKPSEVVRPSGIENLWVMPAGKTPPNPAELLGSRRFADLTASLNGHFDCVIIDTPPVLAVTDAAVVAHRASGVLFIIAADVTSRQAAQTALDQLEHARARFLGAVLNRVDVERDAYYYSRYYRKDYARYYSARTAA
jgi:capsular exopolysaccharide synthesis family protein